MCPVQCWRHIRNSVGGDNCQATKAYKEEAAREVWVGLPDTLKEELSLLVSHSDFRLELRNREGRQHSF